MLRIPNSLIAGFVAYGLAAAIPPLALADPVPGLSRTEAQIAPTTDVREMKVKAPSAATPSPLTLRSLSATHAIDVYPYVDVPDTAETHTMHVQSK